MTVFPSVFYQDPKAALAWLQKAFGFETTLLIEGPDGNDSQIHAEMTFEGATVNVGGEWSSWTKSPRSVGGANTQTIEVMVAGDIDAHCEQARALGATIVQEPADQFYGSRTYRVADLEGHVWTFAKTVREMSLEEIAAATNLEMRTSL
jgi:uncharacterized glyoxalase superfamily protein PhnB